MSSATAKPRFSEAMWFHAGEQESPAAQESDTQYDDDGSVSADELARFNLRTGSTEPLTAIRDQPRRMSIPERELLVKPPRTMLWIALATIAILAIGVIAALTT
jgi:hypothetical protein